MSLFSNCAKFLLNSVHGCCCDLCILYHPGKLINFQCVFLKFTIPKSEHVMIHNFVKKQGRTKIFEFYFKANNVLFNNMYNTHILKFPTSLCSLGSHMFMVLHSLNQVLTQVGPKTLNCPAIPIQWCTKCAVMIENVQQRWKAVCAAIIRDFYL